MKGVYPCSSVRQTFHKGHDANRKSFEAMILVAFLLATTLSRQSLIRNKKVPYQFDDNKYYFIWILFVFLLKKTETLFDF